MPKLSEKVGVTAAVVVTEAFHNIHFRALLPLIPSRPNGKPEIGRSYITNPRFPEQIPLQELATIRQFPFRDKRAASSVMFRRNNGCRAIQWHQVGFKRVRCKFSNRTGRIDVFDWL